MVGRKSKKLLLLYTTVSYDKCRLAGIASNISVREHKLERKLSKVKGVE